MTSEINQYTEENISFIQLPKAFFTAPKYKNLSLHARVLYSLMFDRARLSHCNNWIDEKGRVFIYFTVKEITQQLNCGHTTAIKLLDELDSNTGAGLIMRKKQGFGKPCRIYVKNFSSPGADSEKWALQPDGFQNTDSDDSENQTSLSDRFQNTESDTSGKRNSQCPDSGISEVQNPESNNNNINNNNINNNYLNHIISNHIPNDNNRDDMTERIEEINTYRKIIKKNIDYETAVYTFGEEWTDGIVELMVDVVCSPKDSIRINRHDYPKETVKERYLKIRYSHVENVYFTTRTVSTCISNIREYLITTIYHSYETADSWMRAKANYDMARCS